MCFHLLNRLAAIPLHCVAHRWLQRVELLAREPADVVMFYGCERQRAGLRTREINHSDVLVHVVDTVDVEKTRRDQRACARFSRGWSLAEQLDFKAALLARFAKRSLLRFLIQFDMPAERQPFIEFAMMHQQHLALMNDKNRNREINGVVDVHLKTATSEHQTPKEWQTSNTKDYRRRSRDRIRAPMEAHASDRRRTYWSSRWSRCR